MFVSDGYRLDKLAGHLRQAFTVPVFGCTTAGNIGPAGYLNHGIQAVGIGGSSVSVEAKVIQPLDQCQTVIAALGQQLDIHPQKGKVHRFGVLLVDGLSVM